MTRLLIFLTQYSRNRYSDIWNSKWEINFGRLTWKFYFLDFSISILIVSVLGFSLVENSYCFLTDDWLISGCLAHNLWWWFLFKLLDIFLTDSGPDKHFVYFWFLNGLKILILITFQGLVIDVQVEIKLNNWDNGVV